MAKNNQLPQCLLALDLSTHSTGYCVADSTGKTIDYGCIQSSSNKIFQRIKVMVLGITQLIEEHQVTHLVIEEVIPDYSDRTYKTLTWLQGIVLYCIYLKDPKIDYEAFGANSWRSKIGIHTGRGIKREDLKKADIDYVLKNYGIKANDDICDAICLKDAYFKSKQSTPDHDNSDFYDWS